MPPSPVTIRTFVAAVRRQERKPLRDIAGTAVWNVAAIVRNATLCSAIAWLSNWCYAHGNVFSRTPVREQSYTSFVAAHVGMYHFFSSGMVILTIAQVLRAQYRSDNLHGRAPSLWFCVAKLLKRTAALFVALLAVDALTTRLLSLAPASIRPLKLEFYLCGLFNQAFISKADLVAREILRQETVIRRQSVEVLEDPRQRPRTHQHGQTLPPSGPPPGQPLQQDNTSPSRRSRRRIIEQQLKDQLSSHRGVCSKYLRHFLSTFTLVVFVFVAIVYVQLTHHFDPSRAQSVFLLFTCSSTLLKLAMQELAKWAALRRNVRDIRLMCVAVGVPTVLIDTQIRLVMQRFGTQQSTISSTLIVALLEVAMRIGKVWLVKWEVYRRESAAVKANSPRLTTLARSLGSVAAPAPAPAPVPTTAQTSTEFRRWKTKLWKLYVAEVYADMAAEYIAIGCSTSILFFYGSHPKYDLSAGATTSALEQLTAVSIQLAAEVVVDVFALMLELRRGMDLCELRTHNAFIVTFFVHLAIINIQISSAVYLIV